MSVHYPRMTSEAGMSPAEPKSQLSQWRRLRTLPIRAQLFDPPFNFFFHMIGCEKHENCSLSNCFPVISKKKKRENQQMFSSVTSSASGFFDNMIVHQVKKKYLGFYDGNKRLLCFVFFSSVSSVINSTLRGTGRCRWMPCIITNF